MAEFRNMLADGDLIRQRKGALASWWLFGDPKWQPHRNLSREVRFLEERMHAAHAAYKAAQEDYVVAHKNVSLDKDLLLKYKGANSEVSYEMPSDESILSRRDGVKYNQGNSNQNQKQKGSGNNGNGQNNQQPSGQGGGNNQNQDQNNNNKQRQKQQPKSLLELLTTAKVILH